MTILVRPPIAVRTLGLAGRFCVSTTLISRPFSYDHVVIGAGVVGLAVAAKLTEYAPIPASAVISHPANV